MGHPLEADTFTGAVLVLTSSTVAATPPPAETSVAFSVSVSCSPATGDGALVDVMLEVVDVSVCVLEV